MSAVLATVAIDRFVDGVVFVGFVALALAYPVVPDSTGNIRLGLVVGGIGNLILFVSLLYCLARYKRGIARPDSRWVRLAKTVAVGPRGTVYAADAFNNRVQSFTSNGDLIGETGNSGSEGQRLKYPAGIAVDANGDLFVNDFYRKRILKITCEAA